MTIEQMGECKVLISLGCEDMKNFELEFENMSFYSEHSKRVLLRLMKLACMKAGITHRYKSVLMEALPHRSGCLILVTIMDEKNTKVYRVKSVNRRKVFVFGGAEELMSAAQAMYDRDFDLHGNSLWLVNDRYHIVYDSPLLRSEARKILCAYATENRCTEIQIARIKERGRLLHEGNALEYIGRKILEQSSHIKP